MNVSLKPDVEKYVEDKVKTGQFASPEEAVNILLAQARRGRNLPRKTLPSFAAK